MSSLSGLRGPSCALLVVEAAIKAAYGAGLVAAAWGLAAQRHEARAASQAASSACLAALIVCWHARLGCVNGEYAAAVLAGLCLSLAATSVLAAPLPPNVHLATVFAQGPHTILLRLAHIFDAGEDPVLSAPVTINLATLLAGKTITAATEMTLPGAQPLASVAKTTYKTDGGATYTTPVVPTPPAGPLLSITLDAQQIRTFSVTTA